MISLFVELKKTISISSKWYSHLSFLIPKRSKDAFHAQYSKQISNFNCFDEICTECMLCVKHCPQGNIRFDDGIKFGLNCDMCLKCLHHCPVDAIQIGEVTIGKARYKKFEIRI